MSETENKTSTSVKTQQQDTPSTSTSSVSISPPSNFKPPEAKRFAIRSDKTFEILAASLPLFFRFATGVFVSGYSFSFVSKDEIPPNEYVFKLSGITVKETSKVGARPEKPIEIYEFERYFMVREIVAILDLDVLFYPCPRNSPNFRPKVVQLGGKQQFPYMVDPNTGVSMYESDDIIRYLVGKYGDGNIPLALSLGFLTSLTCGLSMLGRITKGTTYTPAKLPPQPLKLWAYEVGPKHLNYAS
ncbi:hypothetical protein TSUD_22390 [Trifolium subterraneum]|uniref:GST N-terminal domain-containing protein n=1 Tax=Trifolium subterraneum TaxID=3900 RepID=A0A2Z6MQ13_TRISU|nr:hypothetical protein TSUD_22390 [Trifolium subterraneum]